MPYFASKCKIDCELRHEENFGPLLLSPRLTNCVKNAINKAKYNQKFTYLQTNTAYFTYLLLHYKDFLRFKIKMVKLHISSVLGFCVIFRVKNV